MYDVVTFGEAMIRLSPPNFKRLEQTQSFDACVGGAELNVAVAASRLGLSSAWVSKLPENPLGRMVRNKAREHGVDTSHVVWSADGRAGLYFVEFGGSPRPSAVLYDRANSAISMIEPGEVNWAEVFDGTKVFHVSGITPALSNSAAEVTGEALKAAKAAGCRVSYDLNYRSKLWSEKEARRCQEPMMADVDILITTEADTERVFKISETGSDRYKKVARKLHEQFNFDVVVITLRDNISVWKNDWTAIAYSEGKFHEDRKYELEIVDRLGGGDSFTAGFLYGLLSGDVERGLKFGNALAALKHSIPGDFNWATAEEVEDLLSGTGLRIKR
ncbi:MAG: sugar kinase [Planctomycetia bacterium]|nr:sugar kinase [Planctomycetia bacterium]